MPPESEILVVLESVHGRHAGEPVEGDRIGLDLGVGGESPVLEETMQEAEHHMA